MSDSPLLDGLPVEQRLALAYAPAASRGLFTALFALDTRLAGIVRGAREPILAQLRLAWWRDRLRDGGGTGDPVLAALAGWGDQRAGLAGLVDGWEHLLGDSLDPAAIGHFVEGRAQAMAALAGLLGLSAEQSVQAARSWALADLAGHVANPAERALVQEQAGQHDWGHVPLPRQLRPLAVLAGLARRRRGAGGLIDGPVSLLCAIRLGLTGR